MEVENLAGAVVALANVVEKQFDNGAQELRRLQLPRRTCIRRIIQLPWTLDTTMVAFPYKVVKTNIVHPFVLTTVHTTELGSC